MLEGGRGGGGEGGRRGREGGERGGRISGRERGEGERRPQHTK